MHHGIIMIAMLCIACSFACAQSNNPAEPATNIPHANLLEMENLRRGLLDFLGSSLTMANLSKCFLWRAGFLANFTHNAISDSFFQKNMTHTEMSFFLTRKSVMLHDVFNERVKTALGQQTMENCGYYLDETVNFYQDDTLILFRILFGKVPKSDQPNNYRFVLAYSWYEIIFANLSPELVELFNCVTSSGGGSLDGAGVDCFPDAEVMTHDDWLRLVASLRQRSKCRFLKEQRRKVEFVLRKTLGQNLDKNDAKFFDQCSKTVAAGG